MLSLALLSQCSRRLQHLFHSVSCQAFRYVFADVFAQLVQSCVSLCVFRILPRIGLGLLQGCLPRWAPTFPLLASGGILAQQPKDKIGNAVDTIN